MSKFKEKIVRIVKLIPSGYVVSYGQVALMAGVPRAARQVGWILHDYSDKYNLPWWRVINNAGRISTNCLDHTALMQKEFLEKENIIVNKDLTLDIEKYRYRPSKKTLSVLELDPEYIYIINQKYL
ncbi:hypothetical protein A3A69_00720 [candidate division WWE3 bacterium RIFCSPLOWO2_01_FULL_37_15]|uniref:Methylated-DNA-[protein]-cysteine S-methyltransferase DNA binding domain-containing protein n=1 Tax=candidate division WWE3 bacterium RIFCSPLOWO2_01_FULL_37_15 TaxID=1802622 RepID=A0A1F4UUH9_UNCKA|nr:MAG: hypothetical protein A3A69_00720 [candidate division WWE3 bacterium RIFCSPLOWO2_01_FULL_37_15]